MAIETKDLMKALVGKPVTEETWLEFLEVCRQSIVEHMDLHLYVGTLGEIGLLSDGARTYSISSTNPEVAGDGKLSTRGIFFDSGYWDKRGRKKSDRYVWGIAKDGRLLLTIVECTCQDGFDRFAKSVNISQMTSWKELLKKGHFTPDRAFRQMKVFLSDRAKHRTWQLERAESIQSMFEAAEAAVINLVPNPSDYYNNYWNG